MRKQNKIQLNKKIYSFLQEKIKYHKNMLINDKYDFPLTYDEYLFDFEYPYDTNYVLKYYIKKYRNLFPYDAMIYIKKQLQNQILFED